MTIFHLALRTGGLQEDPAWHYENVEAIEAPDLRRAKAIYAERRGWVDAAGNVIDKLYDPKWQSYWSWSIVRLNKHAAGVL